MNYVDAPAYFVDVDAEGRWKGFHPSMVGVDPPPTARPITEEQFQTWLAAGGTAYRFPPDASEPVPYVPSDEEQLEKARARRILELRNDCALAILGGCKSNALGSPHTYPTTERDQANLNASVVAALMAKSGSDWTMPLWCEDATGAWSFVPHDGKQVKKVGQDVKAHIVTCQERLAKLTADMNAATTADDVNNLSWT